MSWYGLSFSSEFVAQAFLWVFLVIFFTNFFRPGLFEFNFYNRIRSLEKQDPLLKTGLWGSGLLIIFVFVVYGVSHCDDLGHCENKGILLLKSSPNEFGDAVAGVASALAFLWIILTVMMQSKELKAQKNELRLTRLEFKQQRLISEQTLAVFKDEARQRKERRVREEFDARMEEFGYAIEWHIDRYRLCEWLFTGSGASLKKKTTSLSFVRDVFFNIRSRKAWIMKEKKRPNSGAAPKWDNLLTLAEGICDLKEQLAPEDRLVLESSRIQAIRSFLSELADQENNWIEATEGLDT